MRGHLIHIGFPKTGSKFLQRWFAEHPQLCFRAHGIAGFQDVYDLARQSASPEVPGMWRVTSYEGIVTPRANAGRGEVHGEIEPPSDAAIRQGCATLAALFPAAHVLIVTRGFRSMILSGYSEYVRQGGDLDFETLAGLSAASHAGSRWDYDNVIGLYAEAFSGRVLALPYELLHDDPDRFVRKIESPLGLDHHAPRWDRVNPSLSPAELRWYPRIVRLLARLPLGAGGPASRGFKRMIGTRPAAALVRLLQHVRPLPPLTSDLLPADAAEPFRGRAERLRAIAAYAPYFDDYLL